MPKPVCLRFLCFPLLLALCWVAAALAAAAPTEAERQELEKKAAELANQAKPLLGQGKFADAEKLYWELVAVREKLYPQDTYPQSHADLAEAAQKLSVVLAYQGKFGPAVQYGERAVALREKLYPADKFPQGHPDLALALHNAGSIHFLQGDRAAAEAYFQRASAVWEKLYPADKYPQGHPDAARTMTFLGAAALGQGKREQALKHWLRSLAMWEKLYAADKFPQGHPDLARNLHDVGELLWLLEKPGEALTYCQRGLAMREKLYPADKLPQGHPDVARSLHRVGALHVLLEKIDQALQYHQRALAMRETLYPVARFPQGHPELLESLKELATLRQRQGDYARSVELGERALAMATQLYPAEKFPWGHPDLALAHDNLGIVLLYHGDDVRALDHSQRGLAMREKLFPADRFPQGHVDLARSLTGLGLVYRSRGEYGQAAVYCRRALAMDEKLYPPDTFPQGHYTLAVCLGNLGSLLEEQGEYAQALTYQQRAVAMLENLYPADRFPEGNSELIACLSNLAQLHRSRGEYAQALTCYQRAEVVLEKRYAVERYPQGHRYLAVILGNLGLLYQTIGKVAQALEYRQRAIAMLEKLYPADKYPHGHPELANMLNELGDVLSAREEYGQSKAAYQRSVAMAEKLFPASHYPQGHPLLAVSLSNLGIALSRLGNHAQAVTHCRRAVALAEKLYSADKFPQGHPSLATGLDFLAMALDAQGEQAQALTYFQRSADMRYRVAKLFAAASSEAEVRNFASQQAGLGPLLSAADRLQTPSPEVYLAVWRHKGALTQLLQGRQRSLAAAVQSSPEARDLARQLLDARTALARLLLSSPTGPDHQQQHAQQLASLTRRKETLERELVAKLPAFRRQEQLAQLGPEALARCLPPRTAFIDVLGFSYWEPKTSARGRPGTPRYVAFLTRPNADVQRIELGAAEPIHQAVEQWRQAIHKGEVSAAAETLSRLVWQPIAKHLPAGTQTIWVAPDGSLTLIPWPTLRSKPGRILLEDYQLAIVPNGQFLLDRLTVNSPGDGKTGQLLLAGDVRYDDAPRPVGGTAVAQQRSAVLGERKLVWQALPGTRDEIEQIERLASPRKSLTRKGAEASTAQLLADLPAARWAHLATHGFFADPQFRSFLRLDERQFGMSGRERSSAGSRNPLVLSGLVLAGANRPVADALKEDGGILSAETIAGLPLHDLELAVLSACETGLGEVANGEGVFGLQRAFHLAGAHNVVASLWKVDDQATAALMRLFYHYLWQEAKTPIEALRQAQLTLYHHPERVAGLAQERGPKFDQLVTLPSGPTGAPAGAKAPVKLWAAFVLSGSGVPGVERDLEKLAK